MRTDRIQFSGAGGGAAITTGYVKPAVGVVFTLRITKVTSTTWQAQLDGVNLGAPVFLGGNPIFDCIGRFANSTSEAFRGGFYYVAFSDNGGVSATRYYDAKASRGTGTLLPDTVNSANNGAQVGTWPADNSEWVFYSSGDSNNATVAFTMPQMVVAANATNVAPGNSASVSFTMPQMQVASTANNAAPVYPASVSVTMPQMQVSATGSVIASGVSASVSITMPQMQVAASGSVSAPTYSASVAVTMPQMVVAVAASSETASYPAAVSVSMPQMTVAASALNYVQDFSAAISFTMPQLRVIAYSGEVAFYAAETAHIEQRARSTAINKMAKSTHIAYNYKSTHIEQRSV